MSGILDLLKDRQVRHFNPGETVIRQGEQTDLLYFLVEGTVEVLKDETRVALGSQVGAVFGEMAVLLRSGHTATVRALTPCSFHLVDRPRDFLSSSPAICMSVCETLARRLDALNRYLVDVKHQFEGHDHIGMVDEVLEALLHRQPRDRVRPSDSTLLEG